MTTINRAHTRALAAGALGLSLALAGCSSDSSDFEPAGSTQPAAGATADTTIGLAPTDAPAGDAAVPASDREAVYAGGQLDGIRFCTRRRIAFRSGRSD